MSVPESEVEGQGASLTARKEGVGFTPGPWVVDYNGTAGHIKSIAPHERGNTPTVCEYRGRFKPEHEELIIPLAERMANAHLIAAAPALYEALQRFVRIREWNHDDSNAARTEYDNAADAARAALKSALGE